jgi:hypothetical protein
MQASRFNADEVIAAGHPPVAAGTVCVDFDGTIFPFGQLDVSGVQPIRGAADAVRLLKWKGYRIVIFSSRFSRAWHEHEGWDHEQATQEQKALVAKALAAHDIPWDDMTAEKIPALAYFDDKAYRAEGYAGLYFGVSEFLHDEESHGR